MLWAKEHVPTLSPPIVLTFGLVVESIKELEGASPLITLPHSNIPDVIFKN
jgi:hypothetical protein